MFTCASYCRNLHFMRTQDPFLYHKKVSCDLVFGQSMFDNKKLNVAFCIKLVSLWLKWLLDLNDFIRKMLFV